MKKKVMVGLVSVVVAVALVFGGVTFYNNRQQEKFEKQMASYESVDTMQHPSEATTSIDGIQVPLGKKPKVTTKKTTKKSTRIQKLKKKASRSKITTRRTTKRRTTTSQNHSRRKVVNTKVVKTQKDYDKKGSKKRTIKTVVQTTTKTTTVELSQMSGVSGTTLRTLGSQADGKILNAFEDLKFKMVIDKNAEATGVFSVKSHKIALQSARSSVLLHELGHFANFIAGDKVGTSEWKSIYNAEKDKYDGYNKAYATQNASEYFAESVKDYMLNGAALSSQRPNTYKAIQSALNTVTTARADAILKAYSSIWS